MRIAIAQMNPTVGDLDTNYLNALNLGQAASEAGADIVIFGAHCVTGVPINGLAASQAFLADAREHLEILASQMPLPALTSCLAQIEDEDGDTLVLPELFILDDGEPHSLGVCVPTEEREIPLVEVNDETLAILMEGCFPDDIEFEGVDAFVEMSADAFGEDEFAMAAKGDVSRLKALATNNGAAVAYVNLVGASDTMVFAGNSCAVTSTGQLVHACSVSDQELLVFDTDDMLVAGNSEADAFMSPSELEWAAVVSATRDYVLKNRFTDVVIGLSGGIDSTAVATVAVDALGAGHVHGVLMPSPYSSEGSIKDAEELAANLGIDTITLPITTPMEAFHGVLAESCGGEVKGLAAENLQARIRTVYLMTLSNAHGWMLLNTGNKSEAAMGFSTLYGDTAGAYAPFGDVYKTRLYELCEWRAKQGRSIPRNCIDKAPSAELYPGAKDEDRLPPYDVLDKLLHAHIEEGKGAAQLLDEGFDAGMILDVLKAVKTNEYKRRVEPMAPHLGGMSLNGDRDWPITNGWIDSL